MGLTEQSMASRRKDQRKAEALKILQRPAMLRAWTWRVAEGMDRGYSDQTQDTDGLSGLKEREMG